MTRMTGPDCAVICNLTNTHIHTRFLNKYNCPPWDDQCEWHRITRMAGPDCAVMCNLIYIHAHGGEHKVLRAQVGIVQEERVCSLRGV